MQYKFNIGSFRTKKLSYIDKVDSLVLPSPKSDEEINGEDIVLKNLTTKHHKLY